MEIAKIKAFNDKMERFVDVLLPEPEEIYKDTQRNLPYVFRFAGSTDPKIFLEAKMNHRIDSIPGIHPALKAGLQTTMTSAAAWFN